MLFRQACNDIRSGRCQLAVVAGCNLILNPAVTTVYQKMGIVVQEGSQCMPFNNSACGYVRQEAAVIVIVSSTQQLQENGVKACAEILGNHTMCGSGASISSPSISTQKALYEQVAAMAAPRMRSNGELVSYIECHATGTRAGDETETQALAEVSRSLPQFGRDAADAPPLLIGSVKSSVGHTESASGLIGLVKVLLSLEHGTIPPNLHYTYMQRNPKCSGLDDGTLEVVTELTPIEHDAVAVVNSFGFGGTHTQVMVRGMAHQAMDSLSASFNVRSGSQATCPDDVILPTTTTEVMIPSSSSGRGAPENASQHDTLSSLIGEPWSMINPLFARSEATALAVAHRTLAYHARFSVAVAPPEIHGGAFRARAFTTPVHGLTLTAAPTAAPAQRALWVVFAGEGRLWPGMASELYQRSPAYKTVYDKSSAYVLQKWNCDAMERLRAWQQRDGDKREAEDDPFRSALDATVCLVGMQICLVDLLRRAGITSDTCSGCIGHSSGEIVAGYFDGCYSRELTLDIAVLRGRAAQRVSDDGLGVMCAVQGLTREEIELEIRRLQSAVEVACHTGSHQLSISGAESDVSAFQESLRARYPNVHVTSLRTFGVAFHSRLVDDSLPLLKSDLDRLFCTCPILKHRSPKWVSACGDPETFEPGSDYHCRGFRDCVEFHSARQRIPEHAIVIDCGSAATFHNVFSMDQCMYLPLLQLAEDAVETFGTAYGQLFLAGLPLSDETDRPCSPRVVFPAPMQRSLREAFLALEDCQVTSMPLFAPGLVNPLPDVDRVKYQTHSADECVVCAPPLPSQESSRVAHPDAKSCIPRAATENDGAAWPHTKTFHYDMEGGERWLQEHRVDERCLFPAAGYLYMIWETSQLEETQECAILDFMIHAPVDVLARPSLVFFVELYNEAETHARATVTSSSVYAQARVWVYLCSHDSRELVASASLAAQTAPTYPTLPMASVLSQDYDRNSIELLYHQFGRHGYDYGSAFRVLSEVSVDGRAASVRAIPADRKDSESHRRKVCILALEGVLQFAIHHSIGDSQFGPCLLPVSIDRMYILGPSQLLQRGEAGFDVWVCTTEQSEFTIASEHVRLGGLRVKPRSGLPSQTPTAIGYSARAFWKLIWHIYDLHLALFAPAFSIHSHFALFLCTAPGSPACSRVPAHLSEPYSQLKFPALCHSSHSIKPGDTQSRACGGAYTH